ncbi:MAG TPA: hypothetical protein VGU69_16290 [Rhizomicrobium sp.]|nr:hypothetical protein [Rhizomicrobium sp.]
MSIDPNATTHRVVPASDARQAIPLQNVRYVLLFSLTLALLSGVVIAFIFMR